MKSVRCWWHRWIQQGACHFRRKWEPLWLKKWSCSTWNGHFRLAPNLINPRKPPYQNTQFDNRSKHVFCRVQKSHFVSVSDFQPSCQENMFLFCTAYLSEYHTDISTKMSYQAHVTCETLPDIYAGRWRGWWYHYRWGGWQASDHRSRPHYNICQTAGGFLTRDHGISICVSMTQLHGRPWDNSQPWL